MKWIPGGEKTWLHGSGTFQVSFGEIEIYVITMATSVQGTPLWLRQSVADRNSKGRAAQTQKSGPLSQCLTQTCSGGSAVLTSYRVCWHCWSEVLLLIRSVLKDLSLKTLSH